VLLLGESGVGKGMIAKLIHKHSERSKGPFIRVDCASITDYLMESELFGYEKGAFTGAKVEGKPGLFELAHGGTLFLDEIGEIPLGSQSKLLRFLEEYEITRVGGINPRKINVRIIAATNRNIEEMVSSKHFRKDLYYRLNVIPIHISPLRERKEDIAGLIFHFLETFNNTYHRRKTFSPLVIDSLCKCEFSGNVRELANLIERLVVLSESDRIEINDLPDSIQIKDVPMIPNFVPPSEDLPLKKALERCESIILERALKKCGSQRKASKILKVAQATISRKMKRYSANLIQ
jgi:transcriptional regulator with PAS, ATPase and Fis domain